MKNFGIKSIAVLALLG